MYYYIFEPSEEGKSRAQQRAVSLINLLGITGEMATPGAMQSLEDLITRAAEKGYNTIVAIGGDRFIAKVASYLTKSDIAFGAIPINASRGMEELLGVRSTQQAVESLKQRRIIDLPVGVISPNKVFLINATVHSLTPSPLTIESPTYRAEGSFTDLVIERQDVAAVRWRDTTHGPDKVLAFFNWLIAKSQRDTSETILRGQPLTITTTEPLPILVNGEEIAKTPCKVRVVPGALKLIQARATLSSDSK